MNGAIPSSSSRWDLRPGASLEAFLDSARLYETLSRDAAAATANADDRAFRLKVRQSLDVLLQALCLFGPQGVIGSFNGGKDAVVVMHLLRAALAHWCVHFQSSLRLPEVVDGKAGMVDPNPTVSEEPPRVAVWPPRAIFFRSEQEYAEVIEFVQETTRRLGLASVTYECGWLDGLRVEMLNTLRSASVPAGVGVSLAFVLGTRRGDPNCRDPQAFEPSSLSISDRARFMRVNPIVSWGYNDVWRFLRHYELQYCCLYDRGFTSIGRQDDTFPNPALWRPDGSYAPAYTLADPLLERAGRADGPRQKDKAEDPEPRDSSQSGGR